MRILLIALVAIGCRSPEKYTPDHTMIDTVARIGEGHISKIKAAIASNRPGTAATGCHSMDGIDELSRMDGYASLAALAKELDQVCYELRVMTIRIVVEQSEATRKANSGEILAECVNSEFMWAHAELVRTKRDDAPVRSLLDRFNVVCPQVPVAP